MYEESSIRSSAEFVEILENFLKEKNISRRQFCALVDIPNSTISSWKSKNVLPSIELVAKVAKFMNVSLDWLVYKEPVIPVEDIKTLRLDKDTYHNILYELDKIMKEQKKQTETLDSIYKILF